MFVGSAARRRRFPARFRRRGVLTLPVTVDAPVFMEMDVGGIVSGASEPVAGIVGFDAFKSSVLEVGRKGRVDCHPDDRRRMVHTPYVGVAPLLMVSNVPHVAADFAGAPNGEARCS